MDQWMAKLIPYFNNYALPPDPVTDLILLYSKSIKLMITIDP